MYPFKLNGPVGADHDHDLTDVRKTKDALQRLGHFNTPAYGATPYPDQSLFDGIKTYQKARGLTVDGVMKPGGETEHALAKDLDGKNVTTTPIRWWDGRTVVPESVTKWGPDEASGLLPQKPDGGRRDLPPWWRSARLNKVGAPVDTANQRTSEYLRTVAVHGDLPKLYADSIRADGRKAVAEFADLLRKVERTDPERAARFAREVEDDLGGEAGRHLDDLHEARSASSTRDPGEQGARGSAERPPSAPRIEVAAGPAAPLLPWAVSGGLTAATAAGVITAAQEKRYRDAMAKGGQEAGEVLDDLSGLMQRAKPGAIKGNVAMPRTDAADPPPPVPPSERDDDDAKPTKTESLVQALFPPAGTPPPSPKEIDETLEGFPDEVKGIAQILVLESRGKPPIPDRNIWVMRRLLDEVGDRESVVEVKHIGGTWSKERERRKENLRKPGEGIRGVRADGELDATMKDGSMRRIAFQTADNYADGETLKPHEDDAVFRYERYMELDEIIGAVLPLAKLRNLSDEEFQARSDPKIIEFVDKHFGTKRKTKK